MNNIFNLACKDLKLITRDKMGMFFIIGFPIAMALFFGAIMGGIGSTKDASIRIAVVDEDQSEMSAKLVKSLENNQSLAISRQSREEAMQNVRQGKLVALIVIPKEYGKTAGVFWEEGPALEIGADPSRAAESGMLQGFIMQAVAEIAISRFQDPAQMKPMIGQLQEQIDADQDMPATMRPILKLFLGQLGELTDEIDKLENDDAGGNAGGVGFEFAKIEQIDITRQSTDSVTSQLRSRWDISFPQAMLWGVLGCCAGFAVTMVRERTQGTLVRLHVAPMPRSHILAGKALACFLTVIAVITVLVLLGVWLGMRPRSYSLLAAAALSVAICFVGVMMLMSVIGRSEEAVGGASWGANILMSMFGGGMVPLAFMPGFMRTLSNLSPVKWGILALEGAIWRGFSPAEMAFPCAVLIAIGVVAMCVGGIVLSRASR